MNIHVVIEGETAVEQVYRKWIPLVNPSLVYVPHISDTNENNFSIVQGHGYPYYFDVAKDAIADINDRGPLINRFVIAIDSEEMTYEEKKQEVKSELEGHPCLADIYIVIQHFCFETWALGNKKAFPRTIRSTEMSEYKSLFNVLSDDPELLPKFPKYSYNRAQFAYKYLQRMLREKFHKICYNKGKSEVITHEKYFQQLRRRNETTGHINSINDFIAAFS